MDAIESYIGIGVTLHMRGKSEAYTIVNETKSKKTLTIQRDKVMLIQKPSSENVMVDTLLIPNCRGTKYKYEADSCGKLQRIRYVKHGYWKIVGELDTETMVELGCRREINYEDF